MSRPLHVLFVEDSQDDVLLLARELRRGGFDPLYERVETTAAMRAALDRGHWDVVISDYTMPDFSGLAALTLLQERRLDLPFLLVSGSIGEDHAVAAMKAGVHDYLMKDNLVRLVPTVERELREAELRLMHRRSEEQLRQAEVKYRMLVEHIPAIVYSAALDTASSTLYISPQIEAILGISQAEWLADPQHWLKHLHPRDLDRMLADMAYSQPDGESVRSEIRMLARDGRVVWFRDEAVVVRDAAGQPLFLQGVLLDITERVQAETQLQQVNAQLAARVAELQLRTHELTLLGEMSNLLQACLTAEEAYTVIASAMPQLFPNEDGALAVIIGAQNLVETIAAWGTPASVPTFSLDTCWGLQRGQMHLVNDPHADLICAHIHAPAPASYLCVPMMARGEAFGILHVSQSAPEGLGEARQRLAQMVAGQLELVLANVHLRETLRSQSIRDPLTGLFNRRYLEESLEHELHRARRSGKTVSVLMLDIDHFKRFNDTFGHEAGNTLLRAMSSFLQAGIREEDIACRYGGEEFTIILPGATVEPAHQRAEQLRDGIKRLQVQHLDQPLGAITISVGVAASSDYGTTVASLLERADAALYTAKHAGRDRVELA